MEGNKHQELFLFIPPYPYPLPSLPLYPYQTIQLPIYEDEHQEELLSPFIPRQLRSPKNKNIEAPFPWATSKRATVHTLEYLLSHKLTTITGIVECRNCHAQREIEFDLMEKFKKVSDFILENKQELYNREMIDWMMVPMFLNCNSCWFKNCMKPVISQKKRGINWLFYLLGDMIGCCTILQLQYFCRHTQGLRYVNKDQLIYFTYFELCKQLLPEGPFDPYLARL